MKLKITKKNKSLFEGASGRIGNLIFYQRYGRTFARIAPGSYNKTPTEKQAVMRARFKEANLFAQFVIQDPELKALYEKKAAGRCSAYAKAVSEYLGHLPK